MRAPEGVSESNKGSQNAGNATNPKKDAARQHLRVRAGMAHASV
jgi:hypothetical protein